MVPWIRSIIVTAVIIITQGGNEKAGLKATFSNYFLVLEPPSNKITIKKAVATYCATWGSSKVIKLRPSLPKIIPRPRKTIKPGIPIRAANLEENVANSRKGQVPTLLSCYIFICLFF